MIKFGTGGWRDVIGEGFTFDNVRIFSQGVAKRIIDQSKQDQGVVIGYDNRFMSKQYAEAAAEVLSANLIPVFLLDESVPTPLVTFTTIKKQTAAGLMITASHNSYIYNGIKFVDEGGQPATEEITIELEGIINQINIKDVLRQDYQHELAHGLIRKINYQHEFMTFIKNQLDLNAMRSAQLKVLYDPMYGTGGSPVLNLLVDTQSRFKIIHHDVDPLFGGRVPAPSETTLWKLGAMMKEEIYDIGIATDGDADRIAVIDNDGEYVHANEIIAILYYYLLEYKGQTGAIVRNVSTTHLLDKIAKTYGQQCVETPVGFKYIAEAMLTTDAIIGGESSGGITLRDHLLEKDGILAGGLMLEMLGKTGKPLTEIRQELKDKFGQFIFIEKHITYPENQKEMLMYFFNANYQPNEICGVAIKNLNKQDGVKYVFENGDWLSVRFSGTEPLLRIMAESMDADTASNLVCHIEKIIDQQL